MLPCSRYFLCQWHRNILIPDASPFEVDLVSWSLSVLFIIVYTGLGTGKEFSRMTSGG